MSVSQRDVAKVISIASVAAEAHVEVNQPT